MEYSRNIQDKQRMHVAKAMDKEVFNDVTFVIGPDKREFKLNRIFLAMVSEPFEKMLFSQFKEGESNAIIQIEDIDADAFESVVNYAYCKNPNIDTSNLFAVKHVCRKYQISELSKLCDAYFAKAITVQNVCLLLNNAIINRLDEYIQMCRHRIHDALGSRKQAQEIIKSDAFMRMDIMSMQFFLQFDELNVDEESLWEGVLRWIEGRIKCKDLGTTPSSKKKARTELLQDLYPFIRFGLMEGSYFVKNVQPMNFLSKDEIVAIANHMLCRDEDSNVGCGTFCTKKRDFGKTITIQRGTVCKKDWEYPGDSTDAICIKSDQRVELRAVGIFNCDGRMSVKCKIYKGDNSDGTDNIVYETQKTFVKQKKSHVPLKWNLGQPIIIEKNTKYTIEILQKNKKGRTSVRCENGKNEVKNDGLTISFLPALKSPNCTEVDCGALPTLYFSRV